MLSLTGQIKVDQQGTLAPNVCRLQGCKARLKKEQRRCTPDNQSREYEGLSKVSDRSYNRF